MAVTKLSNSGIATGGVLKYDSMLAGNPAFSPSGFDSIASVTVGAGGTSTVSFTSIPTTYKHLRLHVLAKSTSTSGIGANGFVTFNGDTGGNYSSHNTGTNAAGSLSTSGTANTSSIFALSAFTTSNSGTGIPNAYGVSIIDIVDYSNTTTTKSVIISLGKKGNLFSGTGESVLVSGNWRNTAAITSMTFTIDSGNFAENCVFSLYGIKGA